MANLAGQKIIAGKVSGERIATAVATADSATFTATEVVVMTVVAPVVAGRIYRVRWHGRFNSTVSTDRVLVRIRENSVSGNELTSLSILMDSFSGTTGVPGTAEVEFAATLTQDKTFVVGMARTGTGNGNLEAAANRPAYLYVDYIR